MNTFYDILMISRNATSEEILDAYRKRCLETHPDKGGKEIDFLNVRKAYEILSDPIKRAKYDKWILQKEKEELIKEIQELQFQKEKYTKNNNTNINIKKSTFRSIIYWLIIGLVILLIFIISNKISNLPNIKENQFYTTNSSYIPNKDSKWLYNELSKHSQSIGTYEVFLQKLKNPSMVEYYYREAKRLKLDIGTQNEFYELFLVDSVVIEDDILENHNEDEKKSLNDINKTINNTNSSINNISSKDNSTNMSKKNNFKSNDEITYKETIYKTGDSPYAKHFGNGKKEYQYDKNSLSELTISNFSSKEAVVLLENIDGIVIRNVYIKNNDEYKLSNIPEGYYLIKVMYGNSWNSEKDNGKDFPKGGFMKNISFSKSNNNDLFDYTFEKTYNGISYPTYSMTLHKVKNGNMKTESISKEEFFF